MQMPLWQMILANTWTFFFAILSGTSILFHVQKIKKYGLSTFSVLWHLRLLANIAILITIWDDSHWCYLAICFSLGSFMTYNLITFQIFKYESDKHIESQPVVEEMSTVRSNATILSN